MTVEVYTLPNNLLSSAHYDRGIRDKMGGICCVLAVGCVVVVNNSGSEWGTNFTTWSLSSSKGMTFNRGLLPLVRLPEFLLRPAHHLFPRMVPIYTEGKSSKVGKLRN